MSIVARRIRATPERSAMETWKFIVGLISRAGSEAGKEFQAAGGVAASLVADETPRAAPIVVAGCGPRLRIYCLYGDDAVTGDDSNEADLTWDPTDGDWKMWLPAAREDLEWVQAELAKCGTRIAAYDLEKGEIPEEPATSSNGRHAQISVNVEAFKRP